MSDPKKIHDMEQMVAGFASIGGALASMFRAMVEEGMSRKEALTVTAAYAKGSRRERRSMLMTDAEYKTAMTRMGLVARAVENEPIEEMLRTLERADAVGPVLDPTAYRKGMKHLQDQRELLTALLEVQKVVRKLKAEAVEV